MEGPVILTALLWDLTYPAMRSVAQFSLQEARGQGKHADLVTVRPLGENEAGSRKH